MLYNGHLVIADIFLRNRPNHGQTFIEKPLYSGYFYSWHLLWRTLFFDPWVNILGKIYLLIATLYDCLEKLKTRGCFYLTHFFTLT